MAIRKPKLAKQLYLVFKEEAGYEPDPYKPGDYRKVVSPNPLGFVGDYAPGTTAFAKKKDTMHAWAYNRFTCEERSDGLWITDRFEWDNSMSNRRRSLPDERVEQYLQPQIINNDPTSGFKIEKTVSRYSTANKFWRIIDPRGFILEITTAGMEEILMNRGVIGGEIQGSYIWGMNKTLISA